MRLGIDLGGTKIAVAVLDEQGEIALQRRMDTPRGQYAATLDSVAGLIAAAEKELGARCSIGVGTPGAVSPTSGLLRNCNSTWLNFKPFKADLEQRLGREIRVANDANCFALSEASDGAARYAAVVFGVILGTGVGGGLVVNKRPVIGVNAIGGEWGHNPLPAPQPDELPGPDCYCGRRGCIEKWLAGPALERDFQQLSGEQLKAAAIAARAAEGDRHAEAALHRYEERLARSLAHVINIVDPDAIVLGGGLCNLERLYRNVPALWGGHVFSDHVATRLLPPVHGDASGVRGAAWLWAADGS
jgi:fructokinase